MKKNLILYAAALCSLFACQNMKEEVFDDTPSGGETILKATIESPATRTSLSPVDATRSEVHWSEGDEIAVFLDGAASAETFTLIDGAGTKQGAFSGKSKAASYLAYYPRRNASSLSGETIRVTLPAEQSYAEGSFASGMYPMAAGGTSSELQFKNLCSVIKIPVKGYHSLTRIVFQTHDRSVKVCGKTTVSMADPAHPVLTVSQDGLDSLAMNLPGVVLKEDAATDFYLVLPAQTYKGGFTVRLYTNERYMDKSYPVDFTMVRSQVHEATPIVFQPNGFDLSTMLKGSGTTDDPFLIGSIGDLILMRDAVNEGGTILSERGNEVNAGNACYLLTADIDLSQVCSEKKKKSWEPVGNYTNRFQGSFDGGRHTITALYISAGSSRYQGLFGYVEAGGTISNLTVSGAVYGNMQSGLLAGAAQRYFFSNCHVAGSVKTQYGYVGGMVGVLESSGSFSHCSNAAKVEGSYDVGGIVGYMSYGCTMDACSNTGIISSSGQCVGGLVGYANQCLVYNSRNEGNVTGDQYVGGLIGEIWQGGKLVNSFNTGNVTASGQVAGGLCGFLCSQASSYYGAATVANCYTTGTVTGGATEKGILVGLMGLAEGYEMYDNDVESKLKNCYWLDTAGSGLDPVGASTFGITEGVFSLTDAQMKGAEYGSSLFVGSDGSAYSTLLSALNAGAFFWKTIPRGPSSSGSFKLTLTSWAYAAANLYPVQTDLEVLQPDGGSEVFSVSDRAFDLLSFEKTITVSVISSREYSVQPLPDWIRAGDVIGDENTPHTKDHSFVILENPGQQKRSGEIIFANSAGKTLSVKVSQAGRLLSVDVTELSFSGQGQSRRVQLSATLPWTAASDADWCRVNPAAGVGDEVLSVHCEPNPSVSARQTRVTVASQDGSIVRTVSVVQGGAFEEDEGDWKTLPFYHQSLAMRFTATWCGWCPRMNHSIQRAQELYPDKIQHLALHNNDSDLAFASVSPLKSQYGISSFPSGIIDGRIRLQNEAIETAAAKIVETAKETEETYGTKTGVKIVSALSGRNLDMNIDVYAKKAGEYKVTVLLLEDGIINEQSDYEEGDHPQYRHDNIARMAVSDVKGDVFTMAADLSVKSFHYTVSIPAAYKLGNMRIFVYVQAAFGNQTVIQTDSSYGDYYVDNCATVAVGDTLKLALVGGGGTGGGGEGDGNEGITPGDDINM